MHYGTFSTWHKLILVCAIIRDIHGSSRNVISLVKQYNTTDPDDIFSYSDDGKNMTEANNNYDFILKIQFMLDEKKIIPYLRDEIYENHEQYNITTEDFMDLWNLREYDLRDLLRILDVPEVLLTVNNFKQILQISNLTFNEYYAEIRKNITENTQLRDTLQILNIDVANFSSMLAIGTEDEVYEVLDKGIYTWEKFEEVSNRTGLNIPTLTKNLILNKIISKNITSLKGDLQKLLLINKKMYQNVWDQMNLTTYDIYRVVNLRRIVDNIHNHLIENITLGVAISEHEIIIHKQIQYNLEEFKDIIRIYGESSISHQNYDNLIFEETPMKNAVGLRTNKSITEKVEVIDRAANHSSLSCFYIDDNIMEKNVTLINITQYNATVVVDDDVHFNFGNPLVCDGKLLGSAIKNKKEDNIFIFDTFFKSSSGEVINSSKRIGPYSYVILFILVVNSQL